MKRLAIITSHPIQYNAPLFRILAERKKLDVMVFYTWGQLANDKKYDPGFGKMIEWDIPLLEGYNFTFVNNIAEDPGTHHFRGIINPTLNKEIEAWDADAILVFGWSFQSHLNCLRYFKKKLPVLFRGDSTLLDENGREFKMLLRRLFLKWVYRHVDIAFYVGENNRRYFLRHGLKPAQLIYAPHAIDNTRFSEPTSDYEKEANELRKKAGFNEDDIVLLFAGKMEPKKNPFFLVHFLKTIEDKRLKILFVGAGPLLESLRSAAAVDDRIVLMDFQNQLSMPVIYRMADLYVLPSKGPGETWGLALNEAMASGRAVASTFNTGGAIDLIEEGINGIIMDSNDDSTLKALIKQSLQDRKLLVEMGKQSLLKIQSFTFSHIATVVEEVMTLKSDD